MCATIAFDYIFSNCSCDHPLYTSLCQCIEGVSALIRGDLKHDEGEEEEYSSVFICIVFSNSDDVMPLDQYICTGFDAYMLVEPDVMEAMALVHSRIRRVIFRDKNPQFGGLGSVQSIHGLPNLNHHYRVFQYSSEMNS